MAAHRFSQLEGFEDRHPGACRQIEAMLKARISVQAIAATLRAQYSERVGLATLYAYRVECWSVWRPQARRLGQQKQSVVPGPLSAVDGHTAIEDGQATGDRAMGSSGDRAREEAASPPANQSAAESMRGKKPRKAEGLIERSAAL